MNAALLGLGTGLVTGAVMVRGRLCFNAAVRCAVFEGRPTILRAFGIAVGLQLLLLPILFAAGVDPVVRAAQGGGIPLLPVAQVVGGLVFGVGMTTAGGCITGILWKTGSGKVAFLIAIFGFAVGELITRGAGAGLMRSLDDAVRPDVHGLPDLLGVDYQPLAAALGALVLFGLLSRVRDGLTAGLALGLVATAAWLAADAAGYGYGLGFVGAAEATKNALSAGRDLPFTLWLAVGVVAGGALGGRFVLRLPGGRQAVRAAAGGVLMGVGGNLAHGCNIGQGVTGLPLLSLGSAVAISAIAAGSVLTRGVPRAFPGRRSSRSRRPARHGGTVRR